MIDVLVIRPEPGASRTAVRLRAMGHDVVVTPIFTVQPLPWAVPAEAPAAIAFTSALAPAAAGAPTSWHGLPCYVVGERTAAAARAEGYDDVRVAAPDAAAVFARAAADGMTALLHLAGADRVDASVPAGLVVDVVEVYRANPVRELPPSAGVLIAECRPWVLLYSARAATHFVQLLDAAGLQRGRVRVAALSPAIAAAAGAGWGAVRVANAPTEDAMLHAAGLLVEAV